jgi:hypothetical protein
MFRYLISRFWVGVQERRRWFLLLPAVVSVYAIVSFVRPHRFIIEASVPIPSLLLDRVQPGQAGDPLLNLIDVVTGPGVRNSPARQAFNTFVGTSERLEEVGISPTAIPSGVDWRDAPIVKASTSALSLSIADNRAFVVKYDGSDDVHGSRIVNFLAGEIADRMRLHERRAGQVEQWGPDTRPQLKIAPIKNALPPGWAGRAALLLAGVLAILLLAIFAAEMANPTLSTEIQLARYLGVPVLGRMPRVSRVARARRTSVPPTKGSIPPRAA